MPRSDSATREVFPSPCWCGVLAVTALVVIASGCRPGAPPSPPPPVVEVLEVVPTNATRFVTFIGQLDSPQNVEVRARIEAFVEQVLFTEGMEVAAGDLLFALDRRPFEERLAAAQGGLAEAEAALNKALKDVARLEPLAERRAIPRQDLDNAVASVAVSQANLLSARARVNSAELDLGYCAVRAPLAGLIGAREVSVGSLVGKGQPTLLATISQLDPIWFHCAISEVDYLLTQDKASAAGRKIGDLPVTLILADGTEHAEPGHWIFLDRAVDVKTGTIRARVEFPNPDKVLRPGMFARARISIRSREPGILVPERALVELQGKAFVWVVGPDNLARQRPVQAAFRRIGPHVVILEGLQAGERIVVEGVQKLRNEMPVQPRTAAPPAPTAPTAPTGANAAPGESRHAGQAANPHGQEHDHG